MKAGFLEPVGRFGEVVVDADGVGQWGGSPEGVRNGTIRVPPERIWLGYVL